MKKFLLSILTIIAVIGCEKQDHDVINGVERSEFNFLDYRRSDNPFSLETMRNAVTLLEKEGRLQPKDFNGFAIKPTHVYLKFSPTDEDEVGLIKSDSTYFVFDYPLHLKEQDEANYLEKRAPLKEDEDGNQIEFPDYFAAIPIKQVDQLHAKYTVIDQLYIPEEDEYFKDVDRDGDLKGNITTKDDLFENLIYKSYELTGRVQELIDENPGEFDSNEEASIGVPMSSIWFIGKKWNPSGRLTVWDDVMGQYIPLKGAQVLMRQVFTVRQGITDFNGYFRTGSVRGKAKYVIQWERYHYSIRTNTFFQAESKGPNVKNKAWNPKIKGGSEEYYGTIHNAAHMYYYTSTFGFATPPKNGTFKRQMKIAARKISGTSSHVDARKLYFGSQVSIQEWGGKSEKIFGTTIHELAHAAHFDFDKSSYSTLVQKGYIAGQSSTKDSAKRLLETWATTVEIYLTNHWYGIVFGKSNYKFKDYNLQNKLISAEKHYTSAGFDMIDHVNQSIEYGPGYPIDRVSGYTPAQLQHSLRGATHWNGWKDKIKTQHTNPTSIYLDELFSNW